LARLNKFQRLKEKVPEKEAVFYGLNLDTGKKSSHKIAIFLTFSRSSKQIRK